MTPHVAENGEGVFQEIWIMVGKGIGIDDG